MEHPAINKAPMVTATEVTRYLDEPRLALVRYRRVLDKNIPKLAWVGLAYRLWLASFIVTHPTDVLILQIAANDAANRANQFDLN